MSSSQQPMPAHSQAEAYLYMMATRCTACGQGPLKGSDARTLEATADATTVSIEASCVACGAVTPMTFQYPSSPVTERSTAAAVVNPTSEASRLIDVGQWIMLFRVMIEAASKETDKTAARQLGIEAAQCLEEALKFYDEADNDLPPPEAFFCESSRQRFRETPQQFSRRRLIELRSRLPSTAVMQANLAPTPPKRWWRRQ